MHRSHLTQELLNYFDEADVRVREVAYTLDAQLLNAAAMAIEDSAERVGREVRSHALDEVPLNIDNRGVYRTVRLPLNISLPANPDGGLLPPPVIEGLLSDGTWKSLVEYDDRLPVPTRVSLDSLRTSVALSNPLLLDISGTGQPQSFGPITLPLSNRLSLWLDPADTILGTITVLIEGETFPRSAWPGGHKKSSEELLVQDQGYYQTRLQWDRVDRVSVFGLPADARLRIYSVPVGMPAMPDLARPYVHARFRDSILPRFWSLNGRLLQESYLSGPLGGLELVQTRLLPEEMTGLTVEPNTAGLLLCSTDKLYYIDRREPLPSRLEETGLFQEPLWGLQLVSSATATGTRSVALQPVAYGRADEVTQYRYVVEDPAGGTYVLTQERGLANYTGASGWRRGRPKEITFPLASIGTYLFSLETKDRENRVTVDRYPYPNLALAPLASIDLSTLVPQAAGLVFDSRQDLWIWTGQFLVPVKLHLDAYLFDSNQRALHLTDEYAVVRIP